MADPIIEELWNAKDELAKAYSYDLNALANYLQEKASARKGAVYQGPRVVSQDRSIVQRKDQEQTGSQSNAVKLSRSW